jgi:hypothetical protein
LWSIRRIELSRGRLQAPIPEAVEFGTRSSARFGVAARLSRLLYPADGLFRIPLDTSLTIGLRQAARRLPYSTLARQIEGATLDYIELLVARS